MTITSNKLLNTLTILFTIAITTLILSALMGGVVSAADITINNSNSTIQEAVNIISDGNDNINTITLNNGTYSGNGNYNINITSNTFNGRSLTIQGESKDGVIIDAQGSGSIFIIGANNITLSNITFINGKTTDSGGAIYNTGNNTKIINSNFNNNSANEGGAIYNLNGDNLSINGSNFNNNFAFYGGAIHNTTTNTNSNSGSGFIISGSNFNNNSAEIDGGAIHIKNIDNVAINYNRFVNNMAPSGKAIYNAGFDNINFSSNWFGSNNIAGMIDGGDYILEDYFVVFLKYLPSNNYLTSSNDTLNVAAGSYKFVYLFALNTSSGDTILNSTVSNLPDMSIHDTYNETAPVALGFGDSASMEVVVDNEDLMLILNVPNYSNGLYVNSSASPGGNGNNWSCAFTNLSDALKAIVKFKLNSSNCNFTIHIAGDDSTLLNNYTGNGVNVNLNLNSSYSNLTLSGEFGSPIFDAKGSSRIFNITANNITISNLRFINGNLTGDNNHGGAIHNTGNNTKIINSSFNNNSISVLDVGSVFGGAIYNEGDNMSISGSNFTNNYISVYGDVNGSFYGYGGAVYNTGDNMSISGSNFTNNNISVSGYGSGSFYGYGGAIYNEGDNMGVSGSNFTNNYISAYGSGSGYVYCSGGAIYNEGDNMGVSGSIFNNNYAWNGGAIYDDGSSDVNINYNRFINNSAFYDSAIYILSSSSVNVNLSSNWFGSNNITGMIYGSNYILDDYFILLLNYSPNGNNTITNSFFNKSKGDYILSFYLTLNTSNSTHIFNDTAYLLPEFNKTVIINNGTYNTTYNTTANGFSSEALPLHYNNQLIAIRALADNEDLSLSLLLDKPQYTNGLYVNSSWNDTNEDGTSWDNPFVNLKSALDAIVKYGLNSSNCNFTIHIAGDESTHLNNYTGNGVNVNLTLNSRYSNLTLLGEFGSPVFDGESQYRIFEIRGNNISLENMEFNNGKDTDRGGAISNYGSNLRIIYCNFNNNFATNNGGAIYSSADNMSINGSNFIDNYAGNGGAIFNDNKNNLIISDSNFSNNSAEDEGGAISNDGDNMSISGSNFNNNSALYGGAIENYHGHNLSIRNSNFNNNYAKTENGGAIDNDKSDNFSVSGSSFTNNIAGDLGGAIYIDGSIDVNVNYNRFINNSAPKGSAIFIVTHFNLNLSSNWFGSNNITGMIYNDGGDYILDDYFVVFLKYLPSTSYLTSFDDDIDVVIGSYKFVYLFALNTSSSDNILNSTVSNLPDFDVRLVLSNGSVIDMSIHDAYYETDLLALGFGDSMSINAIVDNEDLMLKLNVINYSNGLYVNSSASPGGDGHNWSCAFTNLSDALNTIIKYKLNSTNCNFTIHIAGNGIGRATNYAGSGVNVNLELNSSYNNLTIIGEYGKPVFDGESQCIIFTISGNNIHLENIEFNNGFGSGGAIYNTGANLSIIYSNFNNHSATSSAGGGAIMNLGDNMRISGSNFTNNSVVATGGAIYNSGNNMYISGSNFANNYAFYNGGAIVNSGDNMYISGSNFTNNAAFSSFGGAIMNSGINNKIMNSNFANNYAFYNGGAIYNNYDDNLSVNCSNFANNSAQFGGAIYIYFNTGYLNYNITIISNNFVNNTNTTIFVSNANNIQINHNRIYDMDKNHIAVNITNDTIMSDVNWDLNYNWWGNNTPDTNYNDLNNYFVVNVIKNNLTNYLYTIRLNGSDDGSGFENKLPSFNGDVYLDYGNGSGLIFDSKFNGNNTDELNITPAQIAIFTVDDWTSEFNNKITNITINNVSGNKYSTIVILNASINAFDGNNTGIEVIFYINGEIIGSNITNNLGNAYYHYKVPFAGNFIYEVSNNDSNHFPTNSSKIYGEFIKSNTNITINSNPNGSKYGDRVVLNATILDEYNNLLNGVRVDFYVDGEFIGSNVTDSNGIAIYNYIVSLVGDYNLTVVFNETNNYNSDSDSVFGEFIKADSNIVINSNVNGSKYGDRVVFNATILDEFGNPLSGVNVNFYINGEFIGFNVTDSNGIAIYNYIVGFVGDYNLTVVFNETNNYNSDSDSVFGEFIKACGIININNIPKTVDINSKTTIKGNLTDKEGNLLNGKTNLKINVTMGKKSYISDVEVVNGLWSLKINNQNIGITNVKITLDDPNYEGNKEFKYTVSKIKTIITVSAPKIMAGKKTNIVITLKDKDGKILKGKKLIIKSKYLKKPFKATTNSKGQINIRVYVSAIGKYTGTVEFAGDNIYTKSKKTITQIVTGLPDLTFSKIKRIKSSNYQLAVYTVTIKNIGKGDSPKTQLYMQHWKYNGWKSKITKVNIKAIGAGKSLTLTVKFLPDRGSHRTCKYQWFYINPLKNFKEISYKNNLKYLRP
ncbi:MAG: hypothetical protein LBM96_00385 [Methanobrevibacter sp.]|jgi:hypothetical protein|nr:hypothetical protein [Candidatus Methanoflexus mossambicus]